MNDTASDRSWTRLLREPLLHFLAIGAVVFAIDAAIASRTADPELIVVDSRVDAELKDIFRGAQQREPTAEELAVLRQRWVDNEVLYREGLAMRLDRGDEAIRERVIFKAYNVLQANLELPPVGEQELRTWFEANREKYDEPPRVDFAEAVVAGKPDAEALAAFVAALNGVGAPRLESGLRVFRGRPRNSIVASFGAEFADALDRLPLDTWHVVPSPEGPRAIRIESRTPPKAADFEPLRADVLADWRDRRMQELRTAAVREAGARYSVRIEADETARVAAVRPEATP